MPDLVAGLGVGHAAGSRRPARVLFLTGRLQGGGSEHVLLRHATSLDPRRFRAEVLALEPRGPAREAYDAAGVPVSGPADGGPGLLRVVRFRRLLAARCASGDVDLVHAWITLTGVIGPQAARHAAPVPVVVSQRNLGYWLDPVQRRIYRWSNRRHADRMVVNSHAVERRVLEEGLCPAERIRVVHNGVDLERFRAADRAVARRALGLDPHAVTIGMVGTLKELKGQHDLLGALEVLATRGLPFQSVLVGEGPDRASLERRLADKPWAGHVRFLGRRDDVEAVYPALDVCVLCSRTEGFPNVVLEAMACGCAIVTTPVGGIPEAVSDGVEGIHYAPGDVAALATALVRLLSDPEHRRRLGAAALERCRRQFAWEGMQRSLETLYEDLVGVRVSP